MDQLCLVQPDVLGLGRHPGRDDGPGGDGMEGAFIRSPAIPVEVTGRVGVQDHEPVSHTAVFGGTTTPRVVVAVRDRGGPMRVARRVHDLDHVFGRVRITVRDHRARQRSDHRRVPASPLAPASYLIAMISPGAREATLVILSIWSTVSALMRS